ncbi:MAG: DUF624 domain-containing protein [Ruminococcus sp.]|nr:DUF624 domain-containing protein [Ruminococcus sp.]
MEQTRKKMKFETLIERYFSNFHRVMLTNLLFFVPLAVVAGVYYLLHTFLQGALLTFLAFALVVLVFPFYSGVVLVCRNLARGDSNTKVVSTFLKGIRENFSKFLLYGVILAFVAVFSYFSISIYSKLLSSSWVFYALLIICILIALEILFMFFNIPVMTVTFDLSLKNIFRNSFLMSFGEIKNNFFALISLFVVLAISFTLIAFCTNAVLLIIITVLLFALVVPASCQFVVSFYVYDDMYASIASKDEKSREIDEAIAIAKEKKNVESLNEDYSDVDISSLKDTDEYIFYKGKMIKQSVLLKLALEQRQEENKE